LNDGFRWATGIEDTFIAQEAPGRRRLDEYELQQHYRYWREDIDLAAAIGFDSMRYGIPWYRVEPAPGRFDWRFTDLVLPYLVEQGIEPIVDLMHYGTPLWLEGEFANARYPDSVEAYAGAFAERYQALVRWFTPLNEPTVNADLCGFTGRWPPYLSGDQGFTRIIMNIARGIVLTQRAIKDVREDAICLHVEAIGYGSTDERGLQDRVTLDMERMHASLELIRGGVVAGSTLRRYLASNGADERDLDWFVDHAIQLDVLGVNYYPFMSVWRRRTQDGHVHQEGVWGGGDGLAGVVRDYHDRYGRPIFVTECSFNERAMPGSGFGVPPYPLDGPDGSRRLLWLEEAVGAVRALRHEGLPVVGFCWWPLYDLINWEYREGTGPVDDYLEPMGLYALRPEADRYLRRERLPCADRMTEVIATWPRP